MPVQITTRQLKRSELQEVSNSPVPVYTFPCPSYQLITGQHIGLLGPASPTQGLCTFHLLDDLAIVSHCAQTRRTCLVHCWSRAPFEEAFEAQLAWLAEESKGKEVEVLILRGISTTQDLPYLHLMDLAKLNTSLAPLATVLNLKLTFTDVPTRVPAGVLTVEKSTGKITLLALPSSCKNNSILDVSPSFPLPRTSPTYRRYIVAQLECETRATLFEDDYPTFLQYDGEKEVFSPRLGDAARSLLLARRAGKSFEEVARMARAIGRGYGTESFPKGEMQKLGMVLDAAVQMGEWCEICGAEGKGVCGVLGGDLLRKGASTRSLNGAQGVVRPFRIVLEMGADDCFDWNRCKTHARKGST